MRSNKLGCLCAGATVGALVLLAALSQWFRPPLLHAAMEDCLEAACRVSTAEGSTGSGCVFQIGDGYVYVLTAAHVVGANSTVHCEFWKSGHQSSRIAGQVIARAARPQYDVAIVALPEAPFGGVLPRAVPLAPRGQAVEAGQVVWSAGCANGAWATGWQGRVLRAAGGELYFVPPPANGRSGSALFDGQGRYVIGLVKARTGDGTAGLATSVEAIYQAFLPPDAQRSNFNSARLSGLTSGAAGAGPATESLPSTPGGTAEHRYSGDDSTVESLHRSVGAREAETPAQCPGGNCPPPIPYLLPYRYREQFRNQPQAPQPSPAWPTVPVQPAAPLELGLIHQRLDRLLENQQRIAGLLDEIHAAGRGRQPPTPQSGQSQADGAGRPPAGQSQQPGTEPQSPAGQVLLDGEQVGRLSQLLRQLIGDPEKLPLQIQSRHDKVKSQLPEDASHLDVLRAYLRDLASEKLSQGTLGLTAGQLLGAALGLSGPLSLALGGGLWLLSRRIGARLGQPTAEKS